MGSAVCRLLELEAMGEFMAEGSMVFKPCGFVPPTGNTVIDHYHDKLFDLLLSLTNDAREDDAIAFVARVREFREAIVIHFRQEEVIIRGAKIANAAHHCQQHQLITDEIDALLARVESDPASVDFYTALDMIERVMFDHELVYDSHYHEHISNESAVLASWSDDLLIGVPWVDAQHRQLVRILNDIYLAGQDGLSNDEIRGRLDHFATFAKRHFADEEAELEQSEKVVTPQHRAHHAALLEKLDDLLEAYDKRGLAALSMDYLKFWLVDHIRTSDMVDFLRAE